MKFYRKTWILVLVLVSGLLSKELLAGDDPAGHTHDPGEGISHTDQDIVVGSDQAVLEVKGIVCSFCAFGVEKKLSKLAFLDTTKSRKESILTEIKKGRVTLLRDPHKGVDLAEIQDAVKKSGYDLVAVHLQVTGKVENREGRFFIKDSQSGQVFQFVDSPAELLEVKETVTVQGHFDQAAIKAGKPYRMAIDDVGVLT